MTRKTAGLTLFSLLIVAIGAGMVMFAIRDDGGSQPSSPEPTTYKNPIFEPVLADPTVVKGEDGFFYAYGTEDDWMDGEGLKKVPIVKSANLVDWEFIGEAFESSPSWKGKGNIWAPHVLAMNGKYYMYYSVSMWGDPNPGIGVATADRPEGPFQDQGKLFTSEEIGVGNSIDPFVIEEEGKPYLFWGSFRGIYGIQLTEDGLNTAGEKFQIAGDKFEAPYIIKRDGYYYFFGSLGSCCDGENSNYWVAAARSESLRGPYLDKEGEELLYSRGTTVMMGAFFLDPEAEYTQFVGPGHNAVVRDDNGTDWLVYHAIDPDYPRLGSGATRRPLMIDPLVWKDGWPEVEGLEPSHMERAGPQFF